jgi:DNA-binding MarR family transcriptional regulator
MTPKRQRVVNRAAADVDQALASFIADVLELGGLFRRVADRIAKQEGLTQTTWYALSVFSGEPLTVSQAARRLGTTRQAVQRTTNELVGRGLADTRPNPEHRASPLIVLTPSGREALTRVSTAASRARREWFGDSDVAGLDAAHTEVRRLRDALRGAASRRV